MGRNKKRDNAAKRKKHSVLLILLYLLLLLLSLLLLQQQQQQQLCLEAMRPPLPPRLRGGRAGPQENRIKEIKCLNTFI